MVRIRSKQSSSWLNILCCRQSSAVSEDRIQCLSSDQWDSVWWRQCWAELWSWSEYQHCQSSVGQVQCSSVQIIIIIITNIFMWRYFTLKKDLVISVSRSSTLSSLCQHWYIWWSLSWDHRVPGGSVSMCPHQQEARESAEEETKVLRHQHSSALEQQQQCGETRGNYSRKVDSNWGCTTEDSYHRTNNFRWGRSRVAAYTSFSTENLRAWREDCLWFSNSLSSSSASHHQSHCHSHQKQTLLQAEDSQCW